MIGNLIMPSSTSRRAVLYTCALSVGYAYVLYSNSDLRGAGDGECIEKVSAHEGDLKRGKIMSVQLPRGGGLCWLDVVREHETRGVKERKGEGERR